MKKLKIYLISDIYPETENLEQFQEWESKESIQILQVTLQSMGFFVKVFEPFQNKKELLESLSQISHSERNRTVLWNLVEGYYSRNREAYIPAMAEFLGFPFTGSDAYSQVLSLDKQLTKLLVKKLNIPTAKFTLLQNPDQALKLNFPIFIKPNFEGSSLGISEKNKISSEKDWGEFQKNLKEEFFPYLVEEYLNGKEYTVGILGTKKSLFATKVLEVVYPSTVYSAEIKSKSKMPEKFYPIQDPKKEKWIQKNSLRIAQKLGVSGYARIDWKEKDTKPYFLEANLTPGLSKIYSALPICAKSSGISYTRLLEIILESALLDYTENSREYGKRGYIDEETKTIL